MRSAQGIYRNGKKLATAGTWSAGTEYNVFIGCRNAAGSAANFGSGNILRYAHYDFALSDAQIEAVIAQMKNYQLPSNVSYYNTVLAKNPVAYYTMRQKVGKFFPDETGNNAAAEAFTTSAAPSGITVGHDGPTGKGYSARGSVAHSAQIQTQDTDWGTVTGINLDEFSFSCWIRNDNGDAQAKPINIYSNSGNEYWSLEIRAGSISVYSRENGVSWSSVGVAFPSDTWTFVAGYNSLSTGKTGFYIGTTKHEFTKGTSGFVVSTPDTYFPYFLQMMDGYMSHVAFYDYILTQDDVNDLSA